MLYMIMIAQRSNWSNSSEELSSPRSTCSHLLKLGKVIWSFHFAFSCFIMKLFLSCVHIFLVGMHDLVSSSMWVEWQSQKFLMGRVMKVTLKGEKYRIYEMQEEIKNNNHANALPSLYSPFSGWTWVYVQWSIGT